MYRQFKKGNKEVSKVTEETIVRSLSNLSVLSQPAVVTTPKTSASASASVSAEQSRPVLPGSRLSHGDNNDDDEDEDIVQCVETCWEKIDNLCLKIQDDTAHTKNLVQQPAGWQTVRIFVSSTFTDFFSEREILVKKVFPELREWCAERRLYLIDCDMRWGVPKDSTTADTIAACMEELDRCIQETNGKPFFLNMIGQRYGWIPDERDIPGDTKDKYSWVPNTSITFMEILHGAYRFRNPNALFFIRSPNIIKDIPDTHIMRYKDADSLNIKHLKMLKQKLRDRFPDQIKDYQCTVRGTVMLQGIEIMKLDDLEIFAEQTIEFFKAAIDRTFPGRQTVRSLSDLEEEYELQKQMVEESSGAAFGRKEEALLLMSYVNGETGQLQEGETKDQLSRDARFWTSELTGNKLLCVYGPAGYGKTTLLATVAQEAVKAGVSLFYHFCGSTGSSHKAALLLQRLLVFLHPDISTETLDSLQDKSVENLREVLKLYLLNRETTPPNEHVLLIFDALDQLSSNENVNHLCWLPPLFPNNMRCIVSTSRHPPTVSRVQEHPHFSLELQPLSKEVAQYIIESNLARYNKKLDPDQKSLILSSQCAQCPLWLYLICEELRVYGHFRTLTKKAQVITESVDKLIQAILHRLVEEDETGCMEKALCLLACANGVLTAVDLQRMLGKIQKKEPASAMVWAKIRRNLKVYLRIASFNEQIVYRHNAIRTSAYNLLIKTKEARVKWNTMLADYIEFWMEDMKIKAENLPHHLLQAELKARLVSFMRKGKESARIPAFQRSRYLLFCRCQRLSDPVIHKTNPVRICQFCTMSKSAFHPLNFYSNKDMCVICGHQVPPNFPNTSDAYLCVFHSPMHARGPYHCFICDKIMDPTTGTLGKLCVHCGFGNHGKQCAALDIRW